MTAVAGPVRAVVDGASWVAVFCVLQASPGSAPLALPVLAAGALLLAASNRVSLHAPDRTDVLLALWLAAGALSAALGLDPQRSFLLAVPSLVFMLIYLLLSRASVCNSRILLIGLLLAAVLQMLQLWIGWMAAAPGASAAELVQQVAVPWLAVPNDWLWIACSAPWLLRQLQSPGWLTLLLLTAIAATALLLQSRLALGCLALAAAPALLQPWAARRHAAVAVLAVAVAVVLMLVFWHKGLASLWSRGQLWQAAASVWHQHPWTGVGPHNFVLAYADVLAGVAIDDRLTPWPHNLVLELLAEWGVLGLSIAVALAVAAWTRRRSTALLRPQDCGLLLAFTLVIALEASLLRTWVWVMLAALLAPWISNKRPDSTNCDRSRRTCNNNIHGPESR